MKLYAGTTEQFRADAQIPVDAERYGIALRLATERLLPAGSVNQAIEWPSPR